MSDVAEIIDDVDADEQAAFLAEMAIPEIDDEQSPVVEVAQAEEEPAAVEQVVEEEQPYSQAEIKAAFEQIKGLQKALDSTNGTYGSRLAEQQKIIDELKQSRQTNPVTLTAEHFKELAEEYGDDMAEKLARSLNNAQVLQGGNSGFDSSQLENVVAEKLSAVEQRMAEKEKQLELRALNRQHRDWKEVAAFDSTSGQVVWNNPQFGQFVSSLPEYEQRQVMNSQDADFLSDKITQFKDSIKPKAVKKQTIEAAVLPRGLGGKPAVNDEDDEEAAYRAEMARK
jgi:hypothetical protein